MIPTNKSHHEWSVETQAGADIFDLRRRRLVSGDHRRGIAGGKVKEAEDKKRDDRHHRNRHQDSTQDE
jgi:hypothetical protein